MIQAKTHGAVELIYTGHVSVAQDGSMGNVARSRAKRAKQPATAVVLGVEQSDGLTRFELAVQRDRQKCFD